MDSVTRVQTGVGRPVGSLLLCFRREMEEAWTKQWQDRWRTEDEVYILERDLLGPADKACDDKRRLK